MRTEKDGNRILNFKAVCALTVAIIIGVLLIGSLSGCGKKPDASGEPAKEDGTQQQEATPSTKEQEGSSEGTDDNTADVKSGTGDDFYNGDAYAYRLKDRISGIEGGETAYNADNIVLCHKDYDYDAITDAVYPDNAVKITVDYYDYDCKKTGKSFEIEHDYDDNYYDMETDKDGNVYFIHSISNYDSDYGYYYAYELLEYDTEGEVKESIIFEDADYEFVVRDVVLTDDGRLLALTSEGIYVYKDGERADILNFEGADSIDRVFALKGGDILIFTYGAEDYEMTIMNIDSRKKSVIKDNPCKLNQLYNMSSGGGDRIIFSGDNGVSTYTVGDTSYNKVMAFPTTDTYLTYLDDIMIADNGDVYGNCYYSGAESYSLVHFTPVDMSKDTRKKLIMAGVGIDMDTVEEVIDFNRTSKDYRIDMLDYALMTINSDYIKGSEAFKKDIESGRIPDIMHVNMNIPFRGYMSMGLYADQKEFIATDSEIELGDYAPNVIEAFSQDDRLLMFSHDFSVNTVFAKNYNMGNKMTNRLTDYLMAVRNSYTGTVAFGDSIQASLMYNIFENTADDYIDWENLSCDFDNTDFTKILSFAATYPADYPSYSDNSEEHGWPYNDYALKYRNDEAICEIRSIYDFNSYLEAYEGVFDAPITMVGMPTKGDIGSSLSFNNAWAICEASSEKDGAWSFVRRLYDTGICDEMYTNLPVAKKALEVAVKKAGTEVNNYYGEEEVGWEKPTYLVGDTFVTLTPLSKEECNELLENIYKIDRLACDDADLHTIIDEESAGYFMGAYDATTAAKAIQERITEYLSAFKTP